MSGILSYVPLHNRRPASDSKSRAIDLPPVEIHQIETNPDRRARCLKYLLKANHVSYAIVYNKLRLNNHTPHLLSTAFLLGASEAQLRSLYEAQIEGLEPWQPSPAEVVDVEWRDFFGDRQYQRAYVDFFEDKLALRFAYNWKQELENFLFSGDQPLFHGLISGLGFPLVHLGYAYEMDSKEMAMEALGLACIQRSSLHKYIDDASYTKPSPLASNSPLDLLTAISKDERFARQPPKDLNADEFEVLFETHEDLIMEYWNAWEMEDPLEQFRLSQEAAVSLLVTTVKPDSHTYSLSLSHLLTASHAVRVLLPVFPPWHHITLVREWWLLVIAVFIIKGRPLPDPGNVEQNASGKSWAYVESQALTSQWSGDAHYVQAIRTMRESSRTWGETNGKYLQAAVTFVDNFGGWTL